MSTYYYNVGGCLHADAPSYVVRQADVDLYQALQTSTFTHVVSPHQMGKSSLLLRLKSRLQTAGTQCAHLDMMRLGTTGLTQSQWYAGILMSLLHSCRWSKTINFYQWWQAQEGMSPLERLHQFTEDLLLSAAAGPPVVILIDEIDTLLNFDFATDDFWAWIDNCYTRQPRDPRYQRLNFAVFGTAPAADLITHNQHNPFRLGREISLPGFTLAECPPLQAGLKPWVKPSQAVLKSILDWTGGQPFLTQKLCQIAVQTAAQAATKPLSLPAERVDAWVEALVRSHIINNWEVQDTPMHLRTIHHRLVKSLDCSEKSLKLYRQLAQDMPLNADDSREQVNLLRSGLVVRQGNQLSLQNPIYRQVFNATWANLNRPRSPFPQLGEPDEVEAREQSAWAFVP